MSEIKRGQLWTDGNDKLKVQNDRVNLIDVVDVDSGEEVAVPRRCFNNGDLEQIQ